MLDNVEPALPLARALTTLRPLGVTCVVTARFEPSGAALQIRRLDVLDAADAFDLFAERYREAEGDWEAGRDEEAARQVVEALGYLPLAIELAAARAGRTGMGLAALATELEQAKRLGKLRDPSDPTRSVRYVFEQTLAALPPDRRRCFAALSLPEGPACPIPIAERLFGAVITADEQGATVVGERNAGEGAETALEGLRAYSLINLVRLATDAASAQAREEAEGQTGGPGGATRGAATHVRLHPLLREYAQEQWAAEPASIQQEGLRGLVDGVAEYADERAEDFATLGQEEELTRSALLRAADQQVARESVIGAIDALHFYLSRGGHWRLGVELFTAQLTLRREVGDRAGEGTTLNNLGSLANSLGQQDEAARYYEQALVIFEEIGAVDNARVARSNLASLSPPASVPPPAPKRSWWRWWR